MAFSWVGLTEIYYNPAQENADNTFLADAASELHDYLETMSGGGFTVVTDAPNTPGINLDVDATGFGAYTDEAFRIVIDNDDITITGKTAIAVRHGAFYLLDEILGVRWFFKHADWTITPDSLLTPANSDNFHDPDWFWRYSGHAAYYGAAALGAWWQHNRMWGAKFWDIQHTYEAILSQQTLITEGKTWTNMSNAEKQTYYDNNIARFAPNDAVFPQGFQLVGTNADVKTYAVNYATTKLSQQWGGSASYPDTLDYMMAVISPRDGGDETWTPPAYTQQEISNLAFGLTEYVRDQLIGANPNALFGLYCYASYSLPPNDGAYSSEVVAAVSVTYNYSDSTNKERLDGLETLGVTRGWRDYLNVFDWWADSGRMTYDYLERIKLLHNDLGLTWYGTESVDSWGWRGHQLYIMGKLLWDSTLDVDELHTDFYAKAFGAAAATMRTYYEQRGSGAIELANSFDRLGTAETEAAGDADSINRIRHIQFYERFIWKYHYVGIDTMNLADLQEFYTDVCMMRDLYILDHNDLEPLIRAELMTTHSQTSGQVDALEDFGIPTAGEAAAWQAEGVAAFAGDLGGVEYINIRSMKFEALGDTGTAAENPSKINNHDILVYATEEQEVVINVKCTACRINWMHPCGLTLDYVELGAQDWTETTFTAMEAGLYVVHVCYQEEVSPNAVEIDIVGVPAGIVCDKRSWLFAYESDQSSHSAPRVDGNATPSVYFWVPAGTPWLVYETECPVAAHTVTGELTEPDEVTTHAISIAAADDPKTLTIANPDAGLWKLDMDAYGHNNYYYLKGIPPLVWHDPEFLLVEEGEGTPPAAGTVVSLTGVAAGNVVNANGVTWANVVGINGITPP